MLEAGVFSLDGATSVHARRQLGDGNILAQVVIRAQAQSGDDIEILVARRQKQDRQGRRPGSQFAAQLESAFGLVTQPDVDGGLVGGASLLADEFNGIIAAAMASRN